MTSSSKRNFPYAANGIHALVWSPDSKWLVSGNQDPSVHLWIPAQDIELHMSGLQETKVKHLAFDPYEPLARDRRWTRRLHLGLLRRRTRRT